MLDAFTDSMSLAEEATTANGNAEANQEKYMESTAGKLQAIKIQMQEQKDLRHLKKHLDQYQHYLLPYLQQ